MKTPKKNFILENTYEVHPFTAVNGGKDGRRFVQRDRTQHGTRLLQQLDTAWKDNEQQKAMFATIKDRQGTYIEFRGADNCDLVFQSLENATEGIRLLNFRQESTPMGTEVQAATVFIPDGKEGYFNKKIQSYLTEETKKGNAKNKPLVESIETIQLAAISSFWIGQNADIPNENSEWCEFWLNTDANEEFEASQVFYKVCSEMQIEHGDAHIVFPEKVVVLAKTNKHEIQNLLNVNSCIAEIRRAPELAGFYTGLTVKDAKEWIKDLNERLIIEDPVSYVCILDTGVNRGHPLLENVLSDTHVQSVNPAWPANDTDGHGTGMAGVCEYFDLEPVLSGSEQVHIGHKLESVKILPSTGSANDPALYGAITADATSLAEISNPQVKRVYCMAVTADKYAIMKGVPSSWSGELDNIISGVSDGIRKLYVVSAGNVKLNELEMVPYTDANIIHSVEEPGQAWNAITVGAYSNRADISAATYPGWEPVAKIGELSPFSSTSMTWDAKWPVKPEILMDGGNVISDGKNFDTCDEVSILTTSQRALWGQLFTTTNATSAATAKAAFMAAELMHAYPVLWEETIRALMIHSAEWTDEMKTQFCIDDKKSNGIRNLLRTCGYGVASLERARDCVDNYVNMIIQAEIQPYCKEGSRYKTKDMHLHEIPWPSDLLQELGNTKVSMKVTLSYYVEPAPDQKGWNNKYRYQSGALRFDVIGKTETKDEFLKRINIAMRDDNNSTESEGNSESDRWFLGSRNRNVGSIHSDVWNGHAADLAMCKYIAVYPIIGWWRERHNLGRYNDSMRYSLVVSISTPEESVDFYTPIQTIIEQKIVTTVDV